MLSIVILFAVGIVVGAINAVAGGGMLIGFPVLLAAGLPPIVANATGKLVVLPGAVAAMVGYRRYIAQIPRRYVLLVIPAALGGLVGAIILRNTASTQFEAIVPWLLVIGIGLFAAQPWLKKLRPHKGRWRKTTALSFGVLVVAMFAICVYSGYFGVGFGFLVLAAVSFSSLHNIHQMNTVKVWASAVSAFAAIFVLADSSLFDWRVGLAMGAGNLVGGYLGARNAPRIHTNILRVLVVFFGLLTVAYLLWTHQA